MSAPGAREFVIALAGNPNTGKSTVFNRLTGLRQHTGNWSGKTVAKAEGFFEEEGRSFRLVDLPGTISLLSTSQDEEIARDFLLFEKPDVTVVVVDATMLERNLNLVLQILEITGHVIVCLNLMDEATRHGIRIDVAALAEELGVPVIPCVARSGRGVNELIMAVVRAVEPGTPLRARRPLVLPEQLDHEVHETAQELRTAFPEMTNSRWIALRLIEGDRRILAALERGELGEPVDPDRRHAIAGIPDAVKHRRWRIGGNLHDLLTEALYAEAARISRRTVSMQGDGRGRERDRMIDRIVTSRLFGFPIMILLLTVIFWLTIVGSNYPSEFLNYLLLERGHPLLKSLAALLSLPWWLDGFLIDGVYLASAWVVAVMLPPMAIFFPLFTIFEDFGYLPRVAFNLDRLFKAAGAHGKQALTLCMGFGCNAAGCIAARIIESPRERLIAIITNNFSLCNGRWPTQILLATVFIGALAPAWGAGLLAAASIGAVAVLGVVLAFAVSWFLTRTLLRGEVSSVALELPPYRPPRIGPILYTSLIDRTIFVLWRAVAIAMPAGAAIWLLSHIPWGDRSLVEALITTLDGPGKAIGLNGVILVAYILAIPANELVIPSILMLSLMMTGQEALGAGRGVLVEFDSLEATAAILRESGWTLLTAINVMLFSLIHNPCGTTIMTIRKETGSMRWTVVATLLPLAMGIAACYLVTRLAALIG